MVLITSTCLFLAYLVKRRFMPNATQHKHDDMPPSRAAPGADTLPGAGGGCCHRCGRLATAVRRNVRTLLAAVAVVAVACGGVLVVYRGTGVGPAGGEEPDGGLGPMLAIKAEPLAAPAAVAAPEGAPAASAQAASDGGAACGLTLVAPSSSSCDVAAAQPIKGTAAAATKASKKQRLSVRMAAVQHLASMLPSLNGSAVLDMIVLGEGENQQQELTDLLWPLGALEGMDAYFAGLAGPGAQKLADGAAASSSLVNDGSGKALVGPWDAAACGLPLLQWAPCEGTAAAHSPKPFGLVLLRGLLPTLPLKEGMDLIRGIVRAGDDAAQPGPSHLAVVVAAAGGGEGTAGGDGGGGAVACGDDDTEAMCAREAGKYHALRSLQCPPWRFPAPRVRFPVPAEAAGPQGKGSAPQMEVYDIDTLRAAVAAWPAEGPCATR